MKKSYIYYLLLFSCIPVISVAEDNHDLSFTVYVASDYMFRGVSQTDNGAALQLGLDYSHSSGFLAGLFVSNVDYNSATNREQDAYLGYSKDFANGVGIDAYAWFYGYDDESEINYNEYTIGSRYKWLDVKYWHSNDYSGSGGQQDYYEAGLSIPVNDKITFAVRAGHSDFDQQTGVNDYNDYLLGLSTSYQGFDFKLQATGTDGNQFGNLEDKRLILSISKTFGLIP